VVKTVTYAKSNQCPCDGCISVAICRHKSYSNLFKQCSDLKDYIPTQTHPYLRNRERILEVQEILNPRDWAFLVDHQYTEYDYPLVLRKTYNDDGFGIIIL